jgi:hypothetical protein
MADRRKACRRHYSRSSQKRRRRRTIYATAAVDRDHPNPPFSPIHSRLSMADHSYAVEVQTDFLEKITRATPVQALAEFIWNSLDADATKVEVFVDENALGVMSEVIVRDNGTGIEYAKAPEFFGRLGGSWKRPGATTKKDGRFLHGQDGRGRFKVFALGQRAEWSVTYAHPAGLRSFSVVMTAADMRKVVVSDEVEAREGARPGVELTVSELPKEYPSLVSDSGRQDLAEMFALYLADYKDVSIFVAGQRVDPSTVIASRETAELSSIDDDGTSYPVRLDVIEWKSATKRALYLCNMKGFPLTQIEDRRFHIGWFQFSGYLKSDYVSKLQKEGTLELAEMNVKINAVVDEAQAKIREYFRSRAAQEARSVVEEWKDEKVYPYQGAATTRLEEAERQVFDIVAVNVAQYLPDFSVTPTKNKALHLRLLRQAIEKSPEDLQLILGEVLKLPRRKQEDLARLLRDVSLSNIISAAKIVADRLKFLAGLESLLFDPDSKSRLKERAQLHQIIAQNCWLFGEEYNLSVSDRSLTEVLRKHKKLLGEEIAIDEPVKHVSKERGIVDLVLSRLIRRHKADDLHHLVIELKAPKVKIGKDEVTQVEEYALSVTQDERFKSVKTKWVFWAISDDYEPYAGFRMSKDPDSAGQILKTGNVTIWVKTWAQVLDENRARLQFFQEKLEYQADKGSSLRHLKKRYEKFLKGVIVEGQDELVEANSPEDAEPDEDIEDGEEEAVPESA